MSALLAIFPWLCFAFGLLVFGEAAALFIGMTFFNQASSWRTFGNYFFLVSDMLLGLALLLYPVLKRDSYSKPWIYILFGLLIVTHLYREFEYFIGNSTTNFCANVGLFVFNNIKLVALILGLVLGFVALQISKTAP